MARVDPDHMRIVAVDRNNFEDLLQLVEAYQRFYQVRDIDPDRNRTFFERFIDCPEEGAQFLCYLGERPAGFTTLYFPYSSTRAATIALMNDLYVEPEQRGQGIGHALIEKARETARARGYEQLSWMTAADNGRAQRLYDRYESLRTSWFDYTIPTADNE